MRATSLLLAGVLLAGVLGASPAAAQPLQPIPGQPVSINIFTLKNADARKLSQVITDILGNRITSVTVDDRTNSLIVAADKATLEVARALVARLDAGPKK
jgi:type II secretory pathway component GspD/PulD (secretin)